MAQEAISQVRTLLITAGILGVVTGIVVLAWPSATVLVVAAALAANFVIGGIVSLVSGFSAEQGGGDRVLSVVIGLLSVLAGVVVFSRPVRSVALMVVVLAAFWVVSGVSEMVAGLTGRSESRMLAVLSGMLSVVAGVVALSWPGITLVSLVWITGVWLVAFGALRLVMGFGLRKMVAG